MEEWILPYWEKHGRFSIFNTVFFTLFNVSELSFVRMILYNHIYYKNNKHLHVLTLCVSSIIFYLELSVTHWTWTYHYFVMALYELMWCVPQNNFSPWLSFSTLFTVYLLPRNLMLTYWCITSISWSLVCPSGILLKTM